MRGNTVSTHNNNGEPVFRREPEPDEPLDIVVSLRNRHVFRVLRAPSRPAAIRALANMVSQPPPLSYIETIGGAWIAVDEIVEMWLVPAGSPLYTEDGRLTNGAGA
jgi:hypothetical protein